MRKISIPNIQNSRPRKVADQIEERIKNGEIPNGSILLARNVSSEYHLTGDQQSEVFRFLRSGGLIESKKTPLVGRGGRRYFIKAPENPQGGSPERR